MWWSKNKSLLFFLILFLGFQLSAYPQREINTDSTFSFKERGYFGGNLGLQVGTVTLVDLSPLVGVMLSPKFSTGIGATYQYYEDNRFQGNAGSSYGGRAFVRYNVLPNIFAYSEVESINWNAYNNPQDNFQRTWTEAFFVGGGYFAPFGARGGANFTFLYNLRHSNREAYYSQPYLIRVGFVL
jgi:hypothetical protein